MGAMTTPERAGVELTHLDEPLFDGAGATKRDLIDYLDAVAGLILPELRDRPLSVIRVRAGQRPFMQKNVPDYAPPWMRTVTLWAESSKREVRYALCDDRRTLLWLANQRAVEYHPTLYLAGRMDRPTYLVLDIDPPSGGEFGHAVAAARLVRQALAEPGWPARSRPAGPRGCTCTCRSTRAATTRPRPPGPSPCAPNASTRAWPPRRSSSPTGKARCSSTRPGRTAPPWPPPTARGPGPGYRSRSRCRWDDLDAVTPADFTVRTVAAGRHGAAAVGGPAARTAAAEPGLVAEGHAIPIARVQAMHEGKRRARARPRARSRSNPRFQPALTGAQAVEDDGQVAVGSVRARAGYDRAS